MITVFGAVRLRDEPVVLDEVRIPVVGLAAEESVEAVEALLEGPLRSAAAARDVLRRHVVILAEPVGAVPVVLQHLPDRRTLGRKTTRGAGKAVGAFHDGCAAIHVVIAPGEEGRTRRRAERRGVPLRVRQPVVGELLERRHVDASAEWRPGREPGVVVENDQDIRRAFGRTRQFVGRPVGLGITNVELDDSFERLGHRALLR